MKTRNNKQFLTMDDIKELTAQINAYFPAETRAKLRIFQVNHPNFKFCTDTHQNKENWWKYMIEKLHEHNNHFTADFKFCEDPFGRGRIVTGFIYEFYYEDDKFIKSLTFNNLAWYIPYNFREIWHVQDVLSLMDVIFLDDVEGYLIERYGIEQVDKNLLKTTEEIKKNVDLIYSDNIDENILKNAIDTYLRTNDFRLFHNIINQN